MGPGQPMLTCAGLTRSFGDRLAVDDVGFHIDPGETYGLLGPNGAGKSTTIRMICGLLRPGAGAVTVGGTPIRHGSIDGHELIGYVPQEVALYPDLSAAENLRFFGRLYRLAGDELAGRVAEVLALTGLTERAADKVESFSGGMKRRLNIGAALLHRPSLLVLDEPTVGVDPQSRHSILESVARFGAGGMAVLYTTHYMEEAERICDRIGIMDRGRLVAEGTRRELVERLGEHDHVSLTGTGDLAGFADRATAIAGVRQATAVDGTVHVVADQARALLPRLMETADDAGMTLTSVEVVEPDLEAVFLHLTGTALRE